MDSSGNSASLPYIGSKISLISNAEIRYEGILYSINTFESTVALQNVRSFGTEGRRQPEVPPINKTYQFIVFKGKDIKDLTVCEPVGQIAEDPAIVNVNVPPSNTSMMSQSSPAGQSPPYRGGMMGQGDGHQGGYDNSRYGPMGNRMGGGGYGNQQMRNMPTGYGRQYGRNDMDMEPPMMMGAGRGKYPPMRGGYRPQSRRIVGELPAQPNQATKKEVSRPFDFESCNAKFDKSDVANQAKTDVAAGAANGAVSPATTEEGEVTSVATAITKALQKPGPKYDKTSSFFDTISCETLDRHAGQDARMDRDKQRQLDSDTFGAAAAAPRVPRYPRAYRRGGGRGRRGFGGYRPQGARGYVPSMDYGGNYQGGMGRAF